MNNKYIFIIQCGNGLFLGLDFYFISLLITNFFFKY